MFAVTITCGPMGRDVDSLIASMRALSTSESYDVDPYVPPVTFNEAVSTLVNRDGGGR